MSYWTNRQEQLKKAAEKDEKKLKKRLSDFYDKEFKRLEKEIAAYYQQYGEDNVIAYRNLRQTLSDEDRRLLMERTDEFAAKYPQYADLMPVRESIYKLDRLQGLQYSVYMTEAEIAGFTNEQTTEYLMKLSRQGLNYGMETLGFGKNFYSMNSDVVKQFVDVPWCNGENFSTRIWNDTQKLAQYLSQDLAQGFARGDSYDRLVRNIRKRFGRVNRKDAYRLVYTEGTYVMAEATMQPFKDDFEKYRLSPVLDGKTCPICRGLKEQVFLISERTPGVNFPPIHPWCRCSFEIVVDDWDQWMDDYDRRHMDGGAQKIANRLGAKESESLNGKTEKRYIGKVDYRSALAVMVEFENQIRQARIENAVVIDKNGEVYQFIGHEDNVELYDVNFDGAYITHNHPESNGIVSFGKDDFEFIKEHPEIKEFRCCNDQYDYSVRILKPMGDVVYNDIYREAMKRIDPFADGDIDVQDEVMKILAERGYIQYETRRLKP